MREGREEKKIGGARREIINSFTVCCGSSVTLILAGKIKVMVPSLPPELLATSVGIGISSTGTMIGSPSLLEIFWNIGGMMGGCGGGGGSAGIADTSRIVALVILSLSPVRI